MEESKNVSNENEPREKVKRISSPRSNQKLKLIYLLKIFLEKTDEDHALTLSEIIDELAGYDVTAERKSLYNDIECLQYLGFDIDKKQYDRSFHYQLVSRRFELVELKLLVDAVQAAKFITKTKSDELIKKLENYTSVYQADKLRRQVSVNGQKKAINSSVYYSIDTVFEGINSNRQISFKYFSWDVDKKRQFKKNGERYIVSPWAMCWDDEKYYLVAFDQDAKKIKHFRVDKMVEAQVEKDKREGKTEFRNLNMSEYPDKMFGMFEGEVDRVELLCPNAMANVIIDRFGQNVPIIKVGEDKFSVRVDVATTDFFFGWVMALKGVKIVGPERVVEKLKDKIKQQYEMYD